MKIKLEELSIDKLESMKKDLKLELMKAEARKPEAMPGKDTPIKLRRDIKRSIARVNTILNRKRSILDSIERCKDKPHSIRRERRLRGKMKELKLLIK